VGTEGTGRREASGVFGLGFAVEWGRAKSPTVSGQKPTAASASPGAPPALPSGPVRQADAQR
jgi:hypothetical protein